MAPAPPMARVLRGPREPVWGCQCGKNNNWACRIVCSCGRQASQKVANAAKKADQEARDKKPSQRAGGTGLVRKPAPWSKEYGLTKKQIRELVLQCISQQAGSPKWAPASTAPASSGVGAGSKEQTQQGQGNIQQRTELQAKINFHEKCIKECKIVEAEGGPIHLLHQRALDVLRQQARELRPPGAAYKASSQKLARCMQQLDRFTSDLQGLEAQLAATQRKIQDKQEAIAAKHAEVEVLRKENAKHEQTMQAARGEKPNPVIKEEDLVGFDLAEQLDDGAKEALEQFKASPHFDKIQAALRKQAAEKLATAMAEEPGAHAPHAEGGGAGALVKDDVGALWQQLLSSGQQPPSDWTKEKLDDAFTQARCLGNPPLVSGLLAASAGAKQLHVPAAVTVTHTFETFNANQGKLTLQKRLRRSTAMVIMAQEIGYGIDDCESLSSWATARGWQSLIVPGLPSRGHLPSAGLAVFAREGIGLRGPTYPGDAPPRRAGSVNETISHGTELVRGRAQHVVVELPNWPPLNVVNVYLHTGEGMSSRNASILMTVGIALAGQRHPGIIGGDWNMDVQVVKNSGFPVHAQLEMVTPRHATCRTAASVSTIDYFGLTTGSMRMLAACKADLTWAVKPHRPVQLQLTAEGTKPRYLTYVGGAKIPAQTVHGPFLEESSWSLERSFAEQALILAKEAPAAVAWRFLSKAWGRWATRAASRLGHLTATEMRASAYARPLQAKWVEREHQVLTEEEVQAIADGWKWLQDCLAGLSTAKAKARTPEGRQVLDNEVQGFLTGDYCGQNLSARFDASARQARQLAQRNFSSEDIMTFSEDIEEDVKFAMQQANKESSKRWKEWCDGACAGGARKLHKVTRVREVQAPTTVNDSENGITGHPHFVVKDMEDTHAALWKAVKEAPQAWIPDRSTLERDGYADVVIKAHAIEQYDVYVTLHPLVRFASYIDDTSLGTNGATKENVILQAVEAGNAFFKVAKKLGARINDKLAVVASSDDIGKEVVRQLKLPTDMNRSRATYLGTDFAGARRRRGKLLRAKQQARHKIYKQRLRKLGSFRHRLPGQQTQRTAKIFRAGARPAATFGVETNGLTDRELHKMRTDFGKFSRPCHGGVSASAKGRMDSNLGTKPSILSRTDFLIAQDLKFSKLELMQRSPKSSSTSYASMQTSLGISKAYLDMLVLMFRQ
ncbi:unnamed protein product [Prorocentrum cordatum]|uniref:Uncharacterized protein n=1 Tax=Prorocentrum cordatum TaxID=2364126 RepID=A0ABN9TSQ7_9DINO|nr:unnamed protein product [Polarella glacialis]